MMEGSRQGLSRRDFLGRAVRGAAVAAPALMAVGAPSAAAEAPQEPWRLRLATSSIHYLHLPIEQACEEIAKLGFEGVDIWSAHAGCPHLDDVQKRLGPDGLKELLAKHKLALFSFSTYAGGYARYAELLGKAGGGVAVQGSAGPCKPEELQDQMKKFLEGCKPLVELAEKHNSCLAIENHGHALLDSLDSFKAFVDLNPSPRLGIALAPYHVQATQASVPEAIKACGKQLFFFYAWQHGGGLQQLPGHGPTDFAPWLAALAEVRYRGFVNPFAHIDLKPEEMSAALAKSRDYLRECYQKAVGKG
jgi:sugar phosphate isomerase/epimerase